MKLVIVESPTKARTIGKFLGDGYEIQASMGHVMDLPKSKLGVDVEHDFAPDYQISSDKKKTVALLKKLAKTADEIILATDPDREGEAISAHIQDLLRGKGQGERVKGKGSKNKNEETSPLTLNAKPYSRISFHEITKEAIQDALSSPGVVNTNLVDAQTARRVLDRLVGYKLSPILWQKVRRGLSAGRVQSVALRLIVEREREIEKFAKENYWSISVIFQSPKTLPSIPSVGGEARSAGVGVEKGAVEFELIEINGQKIELQSSFKLYDGEYKVGKTTIDSQEKAEAIKKDLQTKTFIVSDVAVKQMKRSPQAPFTTSTLQQQASQRLGYSGKRTMSLAQKLYEEGYITYHRTDSVNLSTTAIAQMREFIEKEFGKTYIPQAPRLYVTKQKLAQEAHEAIRPTKVRVHPSDVSSHMGPAFGKLYELIWQRALASQMSDARIESTAVFVKGEASSVKGKGGDLTLHASRFTLSTQYLFKTTGSVLLFDGFLKINPFGLGDKNLPKFTTKETLILLSCTAVFHETPPPPRYNDASLIKSLEEGGVGRPSTYASIIGTIEARLYIERLQGRFSPTAIGIGVNDFLVKNFSNIDDMPFTAAMEDQLDAIASGTKKWVPVIADFYTPFAKQLQEVAKADRVQIAVEETNEVCPKDGAFLVIRTGKFGKFVSCKNFPTCDFKKPLVIDTGLLCPKDGGSIVAKKTKKGKTFYGCSNYPACTYASWKLEDIKKELTTTQNTIKA